MSVPKKEIITKVLRKPVNPTSKPVDDESDDYDLEFDDDRDTGIEFDDSLDDSDVKEKDGTPDSGDLKDEEEGSDIDG